MTKGIAKDIAGRMVILIRINNLRYQPAVRAMSKPAILHSTSNDLVKDLPLKMKSSSTKMKKRGTCNNSITRTNRMVKMKRTALK